ncbi:hypothetical protein BLA29_003572, partial [Euroglyphus maynei]
QQQQQQQYRRPGPPGSTPGHHKQRIITHVNKDSELPNDLNNKHQRSLSYNQQKNRTKINKNYSINDTRQNYLKNGSKNDIDDFTRLSRLENKIDSYITRYNEIADELDNIRTNLHLIQKEFQQEYDDDIIDGKKNKHVVEIGDRILAKLDSFKINDFNHSQTPPIINDEVDKPNATALYPNRDHSAKQTKPKSLNLSTKSRDKYNQEPTTTTSTSISSPTRVLVTLNGMMVPPSSRPIYTLARAKYAIVSDDEDEDNYSHNHSNTANIPEHSSSLYTSTPSMNQQNQPPSSQYNNDETQLSFASQRLSPVRSVDNCVTTTTTVEHPLYINMASGLRSEHPIIEHCFRRIELLRPRIMFYKSEHKFRVYKELDNEIFNLMNELSKIDCTNDALFAQDKNVALTELHNLAGVLERSIECRDQDCVVCNSFMYKPEISV